MSDRVGSDVEGDHRTSTDHLYYGATRSLCAVCKTVVEAKIVFQDDQVILKKFCPEHGHQQCVLSSSVDWYLDAARFLAPHDPPELASTAITQGCPLDCGFCPAHQQKLYLPVVPITSACNLDCPICYTVNKNDGAYYMSTGEMAQILERLTETHGDLDIINFTGGEPTLHPQLTTFLSMCREAGLRRLTVSTNGLHLLDEDLLRCLKDVDARIVLSLDTFDEKVDRALHGVSTSARKQKALDLLTEHDVNTTILPAVGAGFNDRDVPRLLDLVLTRSNVVSLEMHTLCFTGQGGLGFSRNARITIPDLHRIVEQTTKDRIRSSDFVPSPLAHPHCYSICYLLMLDGGAGYVPFARLMGREKLFELLRDSLYIEPRDQLEQVFLDVIDDLWADPTRLQDSELVLGTLKRLITDLFPSDGPVLSVDERRRIAEKSVKAIYIHAHMDEENFDVSRIMKCCVGVPNPDGTHIPTCAYNVLYRERDERFADMKMLKRMNETRPQSDCEAIDEQ